jgi:hypothetical protein
VRGGPGFGFVGKVSVGKVGLGGRLIEIVGVGTVMVGVGGVRLGVVLRAEGVGVGVAVGVLGGGV